jgi:hypothetical protein
MKMDAKKLIDSADDEILSDLIAQCEKRMAGKFKKEEPKKEEEPEVKLEAVESDDEDDLDEEKMKKLLEMYRSSKG